MSKEVYDNNNFSAGKTIENDELSSIFTVLGISTDFNYDSGFQGMLLQNNSPGEGEAKYVFAFRGTETNQLIELYKDLVLADIFYHYCPTKDFQK